MCELTERLNRRWFWWAAVLIVMTVWGLTDVRHRAQTDPAHPGSHRSDFTVYTTAGTAMFHGQDPYTVTNPRGWHYLYPPLFAILVAPLAVLNTQWQGVVWYAISLLTLWGCYAESRHIWQWLQGENFSSTARGNSGDLQVAQNLPMPSYIFWLAGATVLLPVLNCLQRGQVGILITYLLLLGFRCVLTSRTWRGSFVAGLVLALPVVIKLIPALPVVFLCGLLLAAAAAHRWPDMATERALGALLGSAFGLLLYLWIIPSAAIGMSANAQHLNTWAATVLFNHDGKPEDEIGVHAKRNQSLANAVYRLGNWTAHVFGGAQDDQLIDTTTTRNATMTMDAAWAQWGVRLMQIGFLAMLLAGGWVAARRDDAWMTAAVFGLACVLIQAISPVFRGHYFMLWLPAAWLVPCSCWRAGRMNWAIGLAVAPCLLVWAHYLLLEWSGRVGLLGLGTAVWFAAATVAVIRSKPTAAAVVQIKDKPQWSQAA
jgi:hypothetical protein